MHPEIFTAIRALKLIQFDYRGHYRVVEPHMFGRRQGLDQVLGYQVRGTAGEGLNQDWRMFEVADMRNVSMLTESFHGHMPAHWVQRLDWDEVYAAVE